MKGSVTLTRIGLRYCTRLDAWPKIDFTDDRDGCLFTATVHRKPVGELTLVAKPPKTSGKTSGKILDILKQEKHLTIPELARFLALCGAGTRFPTNGPNAC